MASQIYKHTKKLGQQSYITVSALALILGACVGLLIVGAYFNVKPAQNVLQDVIGGKSKVMEK